MPERLRFSPDILRRLGEELVSDFDQGIIELVKNSYDAEATLCNLELLGGAKEGGELIIEDDGNGMDQNAIRNGWLIIGKSGKIVKERTERFGRTPVGDKGLGRLSALRLGNTVLLETRPRRFPGTEFSVRINWDEYSNAAVIEDVELEVDKRKTLKGPGTTITISKLRNAIPKLSVEKLARNLVLLSDPFREMSDITLKGDGIDPGFKANLISTDFGDISQKVKSAYFSDAEYRILAESDGNQTVSFKMLDWRGSVIQKGHYERPYDGPAFTFELWVFILDKATFSTKQSTVGEVREWLRQVGGVHIYEDGIRVPPYGGPGNDWLDMNLLRARSPEHRPSTNTSVGVVRVSNRDRSLVQKTDRIGFIENEAFLELRAVCEAALNWAAKEKIKERDFRRQQEKRQTTKKAEEASDLLDKALSSAVRPTERKKIDRAIQNYVKQTEREAKMLREELQLYRSLATAGMASAVFAHEIGRPLHVLRRSISALERMLPDATRDRANNRIANIFKAEKRINSFIEIPLSLLRKEKRRVGMLDVNQTIERTISLITPIFDFYEVSIEADLQTSFMKINGSEAMLEGAFLNIILNAMNAFQRDNFAPSNRRLKILTRSDGERVTIEFLDNAGGIDGVDVDDIWLPGVTTVKAGTGFGLTIVKDSVEDMNGSVSAVALTDFGGAKFTLEFPLVGDLFGG